MSRRVALTLSSDLCAVRALGPLFGVDAVVHARRVLSTDEAVSFLEWANSAHVTSALERARELQLPLIRIAPGFLGPRGPMAQSLVVDEGNSVESLLNDGAWGDASLLARARRTIDRLVKTGVSIEGATSDPIDELLGSRDGAVLVVHSASGDDGVPRERFEAALSAASREHPDAVLAVLATDRNADREITRALRRFPGLRVIRDPRYTAALLDRAERVYVASSLLGMEALMRGKPVTCFGAPYYAGWGLTDDRRPMARAHQRSLEQVFAAAYLLSSRYVDHEAGRACEIERVIDHLELQRRYAEPANTEIVALGFSPWKQIFVPKFLGTPANEVRIYYRPLRTPPVAAGAHTRVVVWGVGKHRTAGRLAKRAGTTLWRMEDGFLRSVGLGSDSYAPASLVLDRSGIYFDPTHPSDLETILETAEFEESELARARELRAKIVALNLSKYNVGTLSPLELPAASKGRAVALVIGQVEDDASIRLGCVDIRRNADLLRAARENRPDAFVIYKPHPDVTSGNRRGVVTAEEARAWSDLVVTDVGIGACLGVVDEVHTLTSLVGFEALLRTLRVVVYGLPFYAGWGLTEDRHAHPRRTRRRTLDELVVATLLRYPRYVHPRTGEFTTPEAIVECLTQARSKAAPAKRYDHWYLTRLLRKAVYIASRGRIE